MEIQSRHPYPIIRKIVEKKTKPLFPILILIALIVIQRILPKYWEGYRHLLLNLKNRAILLYPPFFEQYKMQKMQKNLKKAFIEHSVDPSQGYLESDNIPNRPLAYTITASSQRGSINSHPKEEMQDGYFYLFSNKGIVAGVFDGHSPQSAELVQEVMNFFKAEFENHLTSKNKITPGQIHTYLYTLFEKIQSQIHAQEKYDQVGTTAVICYIDCKSGSIITATVGDSEANIYRKKTSETKTGSIALSCIRNWGYPKEEQRWLMHRHELFLSENTPTPQSITPPPTPKSRRFQSKTHKRALNLSRAIGDKDCARDKWGNIGIICKPKITLASLKKGDLVLITSDGLKDHLYEKEIVAHVSSQDFGSQDDKFRSLPQFLINNRRNLLLPIHPDSQTGPLLVPYLDDVAIIAIRCT